MHRIVTGNEADNKTAKQGAIQDAYVNSGLGTLEGEDIIKNFIIDS